MRRLDYEVELALVMGAGAQIAGYAVADDVSARDLQRQRVAVDARQGRRHVLSLGPVDHHRRRGAGPRGPGADQHVNGELRQDAHTSDLIFGPRALVEFIAEAITLEPGDLILTGTPSGVGQAMDPPQFLAAGDVVRCEVEGLGAIEHPIA